MMKGFEYRCTLCDKKFCRPQRLEAKYCSLACRNKAYTGRPNLNLKGHPVSEETKAKIRAKRALQGATFKGKRHSSESRAKMSLKIREKLLSGWNSNSQASRQKARERWSGANNPRWAGGASGVRQAAMSTEEYKRWREQVFVRDNFTCQICQQYGGVLHADHIEKWADNEALRYVVENGRTLCVPCHYYITFKRKMVKGANWCNFIYGRKVG